MCGPIIHVESEVPLYMMTRDEYLDISGVIFRAHRVMVTIIIIAAVLLCAAKEPHEKKVCPDSSVFIYICGERFCITLLYSVSVAILSISWTYGSAINEWVSGRIWDALKAKIDAFKKHGFTERDAFDRVWAEKNRIRILSSANISVTIAGRYDQKQ